MTKVGITGFTNDEVDILRYLLYPYKVEFSEQQDSSDLIVCKGPFSDSSKPLVRVSAPYAHDMHEGSRGQEDGVVHVSLDPISTCLKRFDSVMNPKIAFSYELYTHLPSQGSIIPSAVRSLFLRMHKIDADLSHHLVVEKARRILVQAFEVLGFRLQRKSPPSLLITHDIETKKGLEKALMLKSVEEKLDLQSTWFLPSGQYQIPRDIAQSIAAGSTIGSHDIRHDGRLIHRGDFGGLVERLRSSKLRLEAIFDIEVKCFRSPLLQFSRYIVSGLKAAGYKQDFSLPCWEPVHPQTMGGFGIESVQRLEIDGIDEVPLTLFQDHQVLNVMGFNTREATKFWYEQAKLVRSFDGDIVLLIHPEYLFSKDLDQYKRLLQSLLELQLRTENV